MADSSETSLTDILDNVSSSSTPMMSATPPPGSGGGSFMPPSPAASPGISLISMERQEQENRVLKMELETLRLRLKALSEENKSLRRNSVSIQAKAEQEEEFISNTLLKKIQALKKEKEALALNYEQEEECLTNDLSKKLNRLRTEKIKLEKHLQQEQEALVKKLMRKIEALEGETNRKQSNLEQLRREKIELENTLEQEQEMLLNRLWKRMDKLETEKRELNDKLENLSQSSSCSMSEATNAPPSPAQITPEQSPGPLAEPPSPASATVQAIRNAMNPPISSNTDPGQLSQYIRILRNEVIKLRSRHQTAEKQHCDKMAVLEREEREQREQNLRLQRKLQLEIERRERLCRHLSESESSLEIDLDERHNSSLMENALPHYSTITSGIGSSSSTSSRVDHAAHMAGVRQRTLSSPVPMNVAMSPPVSKVPPSTPAAVSSPISQEHLMPRPISPISRQKSVCCPKCNHFFLASIGSYTNLFANSTLNSVTAPSTFSAGGGLVTPNQSHFLGTLNSTSNSHQQGINNLMMSGAGGVSGGVSPNINTSSGSLGGGGGGGHHHHHHQQQQHHPHNHHHHHHRLSNTLDAQLDQNMYSDDNLSNSSSSSNLLALGKQQSMDSDHIVPE